MVIPSELTRETGSSVAAHGYASLPKEAKAGKLPEMVFTKFVVVSHSSTKGPVGISIGDDVCGDAGYADRDAVYFMRTEMKKRLKDFSPTLLSCQQYGACPERMSAGLDAQLPFLRALRSSNEGGQPLRGDFLPIMMQSQDISMGVKVGAAMALLVQPGGIWEGERVLFVFTGDMSAGLPQAQALHCDDQATQVLTRTGPAQAAEYFNTLLHGGGAKGCAGPKSVPVGFGPMLAAARTASDLRLVNRRVQMAHENDPAKGSRGFASILFWADAHNLWEKFAAKAAASPALITDGERRRRGRGLLRSLVSRKRRS